MDELHVTQFWLNLQNNWALSQVDRDRVNRNIARIAA